jgi:hypothetical protein
MMQDLDEDPIQSGERHHVIIGNTEDYHAVAIAWALRQMREHVLIWDGLGQDLEDTVSIAVSPSGNALTLGRLQVNALGSVWFRRPVPFKPLPNISASSRKFVVNELRAGYLSCCAAISGVARFVVDSRPDEPRYSKAWQLKLAHDVGFNVPPTLVSNDYERIREFLDQQATVIVKFFTPHFWTDFANRTVREVGPHSRSSMQLPPAFAQPSTKRWCARPSSCA